MKGHSDPDGSEFVTLSKSAIVDQDKKIWLTKEEVIMALPISKILRNAVFYSTHTHTHTHTSTA